MTPPHAVGLANGVAQSIVSLARCFGPVLGGYVSLRPSSVVVVSSLIDVCFSCGQLARRTTRRDIPSDSSYVQE